MEGGTAATPHPRGGGGAQPLAPAVRDGLGSYCQPLFPRLQPRASVCVACARPCIAVGPAQGSPRRPVPTAVPGYPRPPPRRPRAGRTAAGAAWGRRPPPPARPDLTRGGRRLPQAPPASPLGGRPRGARGGARSPEAEPRSPPDRLLGRARVDGREKRCETHLVSPPPSCATRHRVQRDETAASSRTGTVKNSRRKD